MYGNTWAFAALHYLWAFCEQLRAICLTVDATQTQEFQNSKFLDNKFPFGESILTYQHKMNAGHHRYHVYAQWTPMTTTNGLGSFTVDTWHCYCSRGLPCICPEQWLSDITFYRTFGLTRPSQQSKPTFLDVWPSRILRTNLPNSSILGTRFVPCPRYNVTLASDDATAATLAHRNHTFGAHAL